MIKVNLAQKKRPAQLVSGGGADASDLLGKLRGMLNGAGPSAGASSETKAMGMTALLCGLVGFGAMTAWDQYSAADLNAVRTAIQQVEAEIAQLDSELAKTQGFQVLKKKLEEDEKAIRVKIDTIEKLMTERRDPPAILKTISEVTPKDIWLTDFTMKNNEVRFVGGARGLSPVSDFMKILEETIYFKEVVLKRSSSTRDRGIDTASFELEAKRK